MANNSKGSNRPAQSRSNSGGKRPGGYSERYSNRPNPYTGYLPPGAASSEHIYHPESVDPVRVKQLEREQEQARLHAYEDKAHMPHTNSSQRPQGSTQQHGTQSSSRSQSSRSAQEAAKRGKQTRRAQVAQQQAAKAGAAQRRATVIENNAHLNKIRQNAIDEAEKLRTQPVEPAEIPVIIAEQPAVEHQAEAKAPAENITAAFPVAGAAQFAAINNKKKKKNNNAPVPAAAVIVTDSENADEKEEKAGAAVPVVVAAPIEVITPDAPEASTEAQETEKAAVPVVVAAAVPDSVGGNPNVSDAVSPPAESISETTEDDTSSAEESSSEAPEVTDDTPVAYESTDEETAPEFESEPVPDEPSAAAEEEIAADDAAETSDEVTEEVQEPAPQDDADESEEISDAEPDEQETEEASESEEPILAYIPDEKDELIEETTAEDTESEAEEIISNEALEEELTAEPQEEEVIEHSDEQSEEIEPEGTDEPTADEEEDEEEDVKVYIPPEKTEDLTDDDDEYEEAEEESSPASYISVPTPPKRRNFETRISSELADPSAYSPGVAQDETLFIRKKRPEEATAVFSASTPGLAPDFDDDDFFEQWLEEGDDMIIKDKNQRRKVSALIGAVTMAFAIIGFIFVIVWFIRGIPTGSESSGTQTDYAKFILPVVNADPEPFETITSVDNNILVEAAINRLTYGEAANDQTYTANEVENEIRLLIPAADVEKSGKVLFGDTFTIDYTVMYAIEDEMIYYYSAADNCFHVVTTSGDIEPEIIKISHIGSRTQVLLDVGYISATEEAMEGSEYYKQMEYVLNALDDGTYYVSAIRAIEQ